MSSIFRPSQIMSSEFCIPQCKPNQLGLFAFKWFKLVYSDK